MARWGLFTALIITVLIVSGAWMLCVIPLAMGSGGFVFYAAQRNYYVDLATETVLMKVGFGSELLLKYDGIRDAVERRPGLFHPGGVFLRLKRWHWRVMWVPIPVPTGNSLLVPVAKAADFLSEVRRGISASPS